MPVTSRTASFARRRALAAALLLAMLAPALQAARRGDPVATFDALAERARNEWGVPGMAVVVVQGERVLLAKGYGVRAANGDEPVDADTLFAAASTTKAMTALALGLLVDEGKLAWDDRVRRHVPELALADAALADELTVRDLLVHSTGLPATDYLWYAGQNDWPSILARLALVERDGPTRGRFAYQNVMYGLAGDLIERVSGLPWAVFVRARIFAPLGMTRTVPLGGEVRASGNFVTPHSREDGPLAQWDTLGLVDPIPAAGSVWTSAADAAKWLRFLVAPDSARVGEDRPLVSEATFAELFRPQVVIQPGAFYPTAEKTMPAWTTYGLGWFQQDYRGRKIDFHTGSIDGLVAIVGLARAERFGVAVFGNLDHAELRHALMLSAFDLFLDGALGRDWNRELRELYEERRRKAETRRAEREAKRMPDAPPARPLTDYAGRYADPLYGELEIAIDGEALRVRFGPFLAGEVTPWHYETFRVAWDRKLHGVAWLTFALDADGGVSAVELDGTRFARRKEDESGALSAGR
jgi:CubicO group peptidase (beta-lactamase class C family)